MIEAEEANNNKKKQESTY